LGVIGKSWGAKFNYFKITNPFKSSLILGEAGGDDFIQDEPDGYANDYHGQLPENHVV
jgi:hypothetical protein